MLFSTEQLQLFPFGEEILFGRKGAIEGHSLCAKVSTLWYSLFFSDNLGVT